MLWSKTTIKKISHPVPIKLNINSGIWHDQNHINIYILSEPGPCLWSGWSKSRPVKPTKAWKSSRGIKKNWRYIFFINLFQLWRNDEIGISKNGVSNRSRGYLAAINQFPNPNLLFSTGLNQIIWRGIQKHWWITKEILYFNRLLITIKSLKSSKAKLSKSKH